MPEAISGAQPSLIAGFDAGQTHTTCRLAALHSDGSWQAIAEGQGSGVSHLAAAGGSERFQQALQS
ncbi:MAG: N-acetylglucosamine kinase, partial [Cyanobacteria bacterium K_DeepCast_150m_m2_101]|nr:N-acetylglucosamine kinase [Cyanobacteria bacterium K_DeepCast_150m_m2_101]